MSEILSLPVWTNSDVFKAVLEFDNGGTYTAISDNFSESHVLSGLDVTESSAITSGNPTGILEPNYCNLRIIDFTNSLLSTNTSSPYYGYMRNGVKVNLYVSYDGGEFEPFGVYYTDDWSSEKSNGGYSEVSLSCVDNLEYIGNKELPALPAYSGVNVVDMIKNILTGIGLSEDEFHIDESLSLTMIYAVTKSTTVREALNSISQALLARIYTDRSGVIQIVPALPTKEIKYKLNDLYIESFNVKHNKISQYNKVKLLYNKVDNRPADTILELNNVLLSPGLNEFKNLQINSNILSIDGVFVSAEADEVSNLDKIEFINYTAYQGGIDIFIFSNKTEDFYANLEVIGRITGITDAYVESEIKGTDVKVANTLTLENPVIQDVNVAQNYVNNVALYLQSMEQEVVFSGSLSSCLGVQDYIQIESDDKTVAGTYLITQINMVEGEAYSVSVTAVKIKG